MNGINCGYRWGTGIMSKKLTNSAEVAVDEALAGLVAAYPGLRVLRGHGVILREDAGQLAQQGKVWGAEVQIRALNLRSTISGVLFQYFGKHQYFSYPL
jgi:hypothetical protein